MATTSSFIKFIWKFHQTHRRDLPWRTKSAYRDPYKILLSELMLQQTQVSRVIPKYHEFLLKFPTLKSVHGAGIVDILRVWKGLGYNRRAYFLKKLADEIFINNTDDNSGHRDNNSNQNVHFPNKFQELIKLPGIGQSTGGALVAFCFAEKTGEKIAFIETNVRSVFIHYFFNKNKRGEGSEKAKPLPGTIHDKEILYLLERCLAKIEPAKIREWYYALYDYGTYLKESLGREKTNLHKRSAHYAKQSAFKGSVREMRSWILGALIDVKSNKTGKNSKTKEELRKEVFAKHLSYTNSQANKDASSHITSRTTQTATIIQAETERFETALKRLHKDSSISLHNNKKGDIIVRIC